MISSSETITKSPMLLTEENGIIFLPFRSSCSFTSSMCSVVPVIRRFISSPVSATNEISSTSPNFLPCSSETIVFPTKFFPLGLSDMFGAPYNRFMRTGSLKVCMARIFSAVDIEDEKLLNRLEEIRENLNLGFNPVKKEEMHITLEFFKDINEEEIKEIKQAMKEIELDSFKAAVKGVGTFPSEDRIRVVWAGVESKKLQDIYEKVSNHSVESDNNHEFKPHITLMRVRSPSREQKKKLKRTIREFKDYEFGKLEVSDVKLFESRINSKNKYKQLHNKEL